MLRVSVLWSILMLVACSGSDGEPAGKSTAREVAEPILNNDAGSTVPGYWPEDDSPLASLGPTEVFRRLEAKSEEYSNLLPQHLSQNQVLALKPTVSGVEFEEHGDSITYTGYLLAAESMHYRATRDSRALASIEALTLALSRAQEVTALPGIISRFVNDDSTPHLHSASLASKDAYTGLLTGLSWAFPLLSGELKERVRRNVQAIGDEFLAERGDKPKYAFAGRYTGAGERDAKNPEGDELFVSFGPSLTLAFVAHVNETAPGRLSGFADVLDTLRASSNQVDRARYWIKKATQALRGQCDSLQSVSDGELRQIDVVIDSVADLVLSLGGRGRYGGPEAQRQLAAFVDALILQDPAVPSGYVKIFEEHWDRGFAQLLSLGVKTLRDVPDNLPAFFHLASDVFRGDDAFYTWLEHTLAGEDDGALEDKAKSYVKKQLERYLECVAYRRNLDGLVRFGQRFDRKFVRPVVQGRLDVFLDNVARSVSDTLLGTVDLVRDISSAIGKEVKRFFRRLRFDTATPDQLRAFREEKARAMVTALRAYRSDEARSSKALRDFLTLLPPTLQRADELRVDAGDGTLLGLQVLKICSQITGDQRFGDEYSRVQADWLSLNLKFGTAVDKLLTEALGDSYRDAFEIPGTHALKWMAIWNLLRLEVDVDAKRRLRDILHDWMHYEGDELNSLADFVDAAFEDGDHDTQVESGVEGLLAFPHHADPDPNYCDAPHDRIPGFCAETKREVLDRFGGYISFLAQAGTQGTRAPLPLDVRPRDAMTWQRSPRRLTNDNNYVFAGVDYQLAYWAAREYRIVAGTCPEGTIFCNGACVATCTGGVTNNPPEVTSRSQSATEGKAGDTLVMSVQASDPDGDPISYQWVTVDGVLPSSVDGTGRSTVTWALPATTEDGWQVSARITDARGAVTTTTFVVVRKEQCAPGARRCTQSIVEVCDNAGTWVAGETCSNVCVDGACIGQCQPGSTRCLADGSGVERCGASGDWTIEQCAGGCVAGECTCTAGSLRCSPDASHPEHCGTDQRWTSSGACDDHAGCQSSGSGPLCSCSPGFSGNGYTCVPADPNGGSCIGSCATQVSAAADHICALRQDSRVACWGDASHGGSTSPSGTFVAITTNADYSCGIRTDGTLFCWGTGGYGQTRPPSGSYKAVGAGGRIACAIALDDTVHCWGFTLGMTLPDWHAREISVGECHACALLSDDSIDCFEYAWCSGNGITPPPSGAFQHLAVSSDDSCAIRKDGTIACWGNQMAPPGGSFQSIALGPNFGCGIRTDGRINCWQRQSIVYFDVLTPPPGSFRSLSTSDNYRVCAVDETGGVTCWGNMESWGDQPIVPPQSCEAACPQLACATATLRCNADASGIEVCDELGHWKASSACAHGCVDGACAPPPPPATFQGLGFLPGASYTRPHSISADGSTVVGEARNASGDWEAFLWSASDGVTGLGFLPTGVPPGHRMSYAEGTNSDGSITVGYSVDVDGSYSAFFYNPVAGMAEVELPENGPGGTYAFDVDAAGSVIVGTIQNSNFISFAFRWDGASGAGLLSASNQQAVAVSADGTVMAVWNTGAGRALRWTKAAGLEDLGTLPGSADASPADISSDGNVIVGTSGNQAFRWSAAGGMIALGGSPGGYSQALATNADGSIVGGNDGHAWIWDAVHGKRALDAVLKAAGADLAGWSLFEVAGISDDGKTLTGEGTDPNGKGQAWLAHLP